MSGPTRDPAALLRGLATAGLTATLAAVAHTAASGEVTAGAPAAGVAVVAATVGGLAALLRGADRMPVLFVLLAAGQLSGHLILAAAGHTHPAAASPAAMLATHAVAVAVGAALITAGGRLCAALSRAVRVAVRLTGPCPADAVATQLLPNTTAAVQIRSMPAGPLTRRGPPIGAAR
ncbi:hypothetical protein ACN27E_19315 [Mycobacterium sp. WMMD1722]|uniref:hypothetical protein n=1 Tax=Mycobacterium sp. WMMD1722 TaxID=3404117 RepID=UPI003BF46F7E